jgi:ABC-type bacteriocin/lantibiotic exporter with double-glycine peptidase domain
MKKKPKSYVGYFRQQTAKIVIAFTLSLLASASTFMATHILSKLVDSITQISSLADSGKLIAVWFGYEVTNIFLTYIASRILVIVGTRIKNHIKSDMSSKFAKSTVETVLRSDPTDLSEKLSTDVDRFVDSVSNLYSEFFSVATGVASLIYAVTISFEIFLMFLVSFSILLLVHYFQKKKMISANLKARKSNTNTKGLWIQIFQAFSDIKAQSLTSGMKPHVYSVMQEEKETSYNAQKVTLNSTLISKVLSTVSQSIFLTLSAVLILSTKLTASNFFALYLYRHNIYGLADTSLRIVKFKAELDTARTRIDSIFGLSKEKWGHTRFTNPSGTVTLQNVSASYGENKVLDDISVELPANSVIGVVGASGCGKSTLLKILDKEIPYSGKIWLDEVGGSSKVELSSLDEYSHRKIFAMAPQQPYLFDFTIKENLCLADPDASPAKIWDCLEECAAAEFVRQKGGLDIKLTPKELSGGQRQRLALARLCLRGGKIILMDESTSALDSESQAIVMKTVHEAAARGHTMVLVAHRVSTLKSADKILLMDKGKIIAEGTYSELYETSEKFRRLADLG